MRIGSGGRQIASQFERNRVVHPAVAIAVGAHAAAEEGEEGHAQQFLEGWVRLVGEGEGGAGFGEGVGVASLGC